jgi:P-type Cu+ transporter
MTKRIYLKITGMHCSGCSGSVEKALKEVPGVTSATVALAEQKATVEFDPALTDQKKMEKAVKGAGFGVAPQ